MEAEHDRGVEREEKEALMGREESEGRRNKREEKVGWKREETLRGRG